MTPEEIKAELARLEGLKQSAIDSYAKMIGEVVKQLIPLVQVIIPSLIPIVQFAVTFQTEINGIDESIRELEGLANDT